MTLQVVDATQWALASTLYTAAIVTVIFAMTWPAAGAIESAAALTLKSPFTPDLPSTRRAVDHRMLAIAAAFFAVASLSSVAVIRSRETALNAHEAHLRHDVAHGAVPLRQVVAPSRGEASTPSRLGS